MKLEYHRVGTGPNNVVIFHDWFSDCSSYDSLKPYLDTEKASFFFIDLRGYGLSKEIQGEYTLEEAASDFKDTIEAINLEGAIHVVGHSMTGMLVQYLGYKHPDLLKSIVAICPVAADGMEMPEESHALLSAAAQGDVNSTIEIAKSMTANRYDCSFIDYKVRAWFDSSTQEARLGYLKMFIESNFAQELQDIHTPIHVICCEYDSEAHHGSHLEPRIGKWFSAATFETLKEAAHYPMHEVPVNLLNALSAFWEKNGWSA